MKIFLALGLLLIFALAQKAVADEIVPYSFQLLAVKSY